MRYNHSRNIPSRKTKKLTGSKTRAIFLYNVPNVTNAPLKCRKTNQKKKNRHCTRNSTKLIG